MFTLIILIAIVIVIGLYLAPKHTKATINYTGKGIRGTALHAHAIKKDIQAYVVEHPEAIAQYTQGLNDIVDLETFHAEATKTYKTSSLALKAEMDKFNKAEATQA